MDARELALVQRPVRGRGSRKRRTLARCNQDTSTILRTMAGQGLCLADTLFMNMAGFSSMYADMALRHLLSGRSSLGGVPSEPPCDFALRRRKRQRKTASCMKLEAVPLSSAEKKSAVSAAKAIEKQHLLFAQSLFAALEPHCSRRTGDPVPFSKGPRGLDGPASLPSPAEGVRPTF